MLKRTTHNNAPLNFGAGEDTMVLREDVEEAILKFLGKSNPTPLELINILAKKFPVYEIRIALVEMRRYDLIGSDRQFRLFLTPAGQKRAVI